MFQAFNRKKGSKKPGLSNFDLSTEYTPEMAESSKNNSGDRPVSPTLTKEDMNAWRYDCKRARAEWPNMNKWPCMYCRMGIDCKNGEAAVYCNYMYCEAKHKLQFTYYQSKPKPNMEEWNAQQRQKNQTEVEEFLERERKDLEREEQTWDWI